MMSFLNRKSGKLEVVSRLVATEFELAIAKSFVRILSSSALEIFLSKCNKNYWSINLDAR